MLKNLTFKWEDRNNPLTVGIDLQAGAIKTTHRKSFFADFYILLRLLVVCRKGI